MTFYQLEGIPGLRIFIELRRLWLEMEKSETRKRQSLGILLFPSLGPQ